MANEEAARALQVLVSDGVISSGRMRELLGMSIHDQRKFWRSENWQAGIPAIHAEVRKEAEGLSRVIVSIEINDAWRTIIDESRVDGGHTSHIIEPKGIAAMLEAQREVRDGVED